MKVDVLALDRIQRQKRMSCKALAEMTGFPAQTVSMIRNRGTATKMTIRRLAEALGVDPDDLTQKERPTNEGKEKSRAKRSR